MLVISEDRLNRFKNTKFKVYSREPLSDGCECFSSNESFDKNETFYITSVKASNIKNDNGKFYYTTEEFDDVADFWPKHIMNLGSNFVPSKRKKSCIKSNKCIVDVSGLPAFNGLPSTNEDVTVNDYRFYLTLFNNYTIEQCRFERHDLFDAKFKSSKYDLVSKIQNSDFLKSKDFVMINSRRKEEESVPVGLIVKENADTKKEINIEYGTVYINMENQVSIIWN